MDAGKKSDENNGMFRHLVTSDNILNKFVFESGQFPDVWKEAIGYPLLKKVDLDTSFTNLRLISNLSYISKLTEKAVFQQLNNHLSLHELYPKLQSAYRKNHSTETALLKVTNDVLVNMNSQRVALLVLLDLSAAFDTIDHSIQGV